MFRHRPRSVHGTRWKAWFNASPALLVVACMLLAIPGCEQPARVTGLVTLDGEPLTTGVITFNPAAGGPTAYGAIGTDGRYDLRVGAAEGLASGDYVVTVAANASAPAAPPEQPEAGSPDAGPPVLPLVTPEKYADLDRTPLRATVKGGEQTLEFHLTSQ